jgi:hypothetical protein
MELLKTGLHLISGQKAKRGKILKGDSVSVVAAQKKILADITNTDQPKHHPAPPVLTPANDVSVEMILKVCYIMLLLLLFD